MTTYYLAGPMRGIPNGNIPAFEQAAAALRALGYTIISPVEMDTAETLADTRLGTELAEYGGKKPGEILAQDVEVIHDRVDGIIFLPGWTQSRGARLEAFVGLISNKNFLAYYAPGAVLPMSADEVRHNLTENMP